MAEQGKKPELAWLPVVRLSVDRSYQRSIESRRSQALIAEIAANFRWPRFGCVMAVKHGDDWQLIDGQHRVEAARLAPVGHVPAVVLPHGDPAEAARDFIAINRDRVTMHSLMVHHALVAAGDRGAARIDRACRAARVTIARYPKPAGNMAPRETLAVGVIRKLVSTRGEEKLAAILRAIADAVEDSPGDLRAVIIEAVAHLDDDGMPPETAAGPLRDGGVADVLRASPYRPEHTNAQRVAAESEARVAGRGSKERNCLSCGEAFISSGPGHRMCDRCRKRSE